MNLMDVLKDPPQPHEDAQGGHMVMGLTEQALNFIFDQIDDSCATLETGCGLSTVVFALTGSKHTVIAPAPSEFEITKSYCRERGISFDQINFITEPSQKVLPNLKTPPLDLVLIDGGHGFPTPFVDWFYTAGKLKKDGFVIVDDVWLWSCGILRDFLAAQPQWEFVDEYDGRTAVFRKVDEGSEWLEWTQQPLVAQGGRLKWIDGGIVDSASADSTPFTRALHDLKSGNITGLARKTARRVFGSR